MKTRTSTLLLICLLHCACAAAHDGETNDAEHKHAGPFTTDQGQTPPPQAKSYLPFEKEGLQISWSAETLFIEGNGLPAHPMMKGITAWQQQVPIPHPYRGDNAFQLPLKPTIAEKPGELTLIGPIAIAVNGIPIFHALTQSGKDAYAGGELDEWGGHCGRADDYHYHIAPAHLEKVVGKGNPVAYALDGFPIHVADPEKDKPLDECHGYFDDEGKYRYVGNLEPPYMMSYFRGVADLDKRPRAHGVRPALRPLRGARITGFEGSLEKGYHLIYEIGEERRHIRYQLEASKMTMQFTGADGTTTEEAHTRRDQGKVGGQKPRKPGRSPRSGEDRAKGKKTRE